MSVLRNTLVPSDPRNVSAEEESNVFDAVEALANLADRMVGYIKEKRERPLEPAELNKYWKGGILSWFTFLFDHYHPAVDSDAADRWTVISYVSCVFTYFIRADKPLVSETPGTVHLAARLWLLKDYDYERSKYALHCGWWDPCLELLAPKGEEMICMTETLREELYSVEGVSRRSMMNLILTRIDNTTPGVQDILGLNQLRRLMGFLSDFDILERSIEVPFRRIAHVLSKKAAYLVDLINPRQYHVPLQLTCLNFLDHLQSVLLFSWSIEPVAIAIRSGLLRAFVKFCKTLSQIKSDRNAKLNITEPAIAAITKLIAKTIPRYMVFSSVLSAINSELEFISDKHMAKTMLAGEWNTFRRLFESNKAFLDNTNLPRLSYCDNLKHDINYNSGEIYECSGCEKIKYCSEKCQREDWVDIHRTECRIAAKLNDDMIRHKTLHMRDQLSVCRFAIMTVRLQWKSIQERALREHPNVPLSRLTLFFDFTKHPHVLRLQDRELDDYESAMNAVKYVPDATVVQCYVTLGLYKVTVTAAGDINDIENKSWVTRAPEIVERSLPMSALPYLPKDALFSYNDHPEY